MRRLSMISLLIYELKKWGHVVIIKNNKKYFLNAYLLISFQDDLLISMEIINWIWMKETFVILANGI